MEILKKELEILLLDSEGYISPEIEELMAQIFKNENIESNLSWLLRKYENSIALEKERSDKLEKIKTKVNSAEKAVEYWKNKIDEQLKANKLVKLSIDEFDLSYRSSTRVEIVNKDLISDEFIKREITVSIKKADIMKALKSGKKVEGAELIENQNLQIN